MSKPTGPWRIFRIPLALGVVSGAGLVGALLVSGPFDAAWTLAVAVPVVVFGGAIARPKP